MLITKDFHLLPGLLAGMHLFPHPIAQHFMSPLQSASVLHLDVHVKLTDLGTTGHFPGLTEKQRTLIHWNKFSNR